MRSAYVAPPGRCIDCGHSIPEKKCAACRTPYPIDRLKKVEKEARGLAAWCREFVGSVTDHNGVSIKGDFDEFLGTLEAALDMKVS